MREITKEVVHSFDGEDITFQITKMDALRGTWLMKFCVEKILPLFNKLRDVFAQEPDDSKTDEELAKERTEQIIAILPDVLASLSEDDVLTLEKRCLSTVKAVVPGGLHPVLSGDHFGLEELEYDIMTTLVLCYEVIEFNLGSFFGGSLSALRLRRQDT